MFTSCDSWAIRLVLRVRITDPKVEQVSDLTNLPTTGNVGPQGRVSVPMSPCLYSKISGPRIYTPPIRKSIELCL